MKKVSETITWLKTPGHVKCLLVEISEIGNTSSPNLYLSSTPYTSNSVVYTPNLQGGISFSESLSIDGTASLSFGSIDIANTTGQYDTYLTYVWSKRPLKIYLGDPSWPKSDFVLIFDGLAQDITAQDENTLSITIFDKLQRLNDNLTETLLSDTDYSENTKETTLPLQFGECFNVSPLLVDNGSTTGLGPVYMIHNGTINGIIEVRDNGVPIFAEENLPYGVFSLPVQAYGTITCSAQGRTPYSNTVSDIIADIVTNYVSQQNAFTSNELSFSSFTNTSAVGIYCNQRTNILQVCAELAQSVNANLICPAILVENDEIVNSKLKLVELKAPTGVATYYLNDNNMLEGSLRVAEAFPVKPEIKLGYCKNFTLQQTTASGVNPTTNYSEEYLFVTAANQNQKYLYRDTGAVAIENTLLLTTQQAQAEANKRLDLWGVPRYLITAKYLPELIFVQLGDTVAVSSDRFGLNNGKTGMVYSITRDWTTGLVEIGVLV